MDQIISYTVKYRKRFITRTIKDVIVDGFIPDQNMRFFILRDMSRIEIPTDYTFEFSSDRDKAYKIGLEKQQRLEEEKKNQPQQGVMMPYTPPIT